MRRLKVEYDIFFGGGSKKPPADIEWKVKNLLRKMSDGSRMSYGQRFRFSTLQQRYALYNTQWQQKLQIKEEGYRRPQDAILSIQGVREEKEHESHHHHAYGVGHPAGGADGSNSSPHFTLHSVDQSEREQVERLYNILVAAKNKAGEKVTGSFDSFSTFVQKKTEQIRKQYRCDEVEYSVELANGHVKLKAKAKP